MLVSSETGQGREISLDSALAEKLFGGYSYEKGTDGNFVDQDGKELTYKGADGKYYVKDGTFKDKQEIGRAHV